MTTPGSLEVARFLVSPAGRAAAAALPADFDPRRLLLELRKNLEPWQAAALLDQERGRRSLRGRHHLAESLVVDALAAAQASAEACALRRAARFPNDALVADLGCSVGIDSLALAAGRRLVALDREPGRLILARANLELAGQSALLVCGAAPAAAPRCPFLHADPDRRPEGRRRHHPEEASPRLSELLALAPAGGLVVKLSPLAPLEELEGLGELDFVGLGAELKELVLVTGDLARPGRCVSLADRDVEYRAEPRPARVAAELGDVLYEAHPALVRSGLLGALAAELGLGLVAEGIAFLTGPAVGDQALLMANEVLAVLPADPRRIGRFMRERDFGRAEVRARGFPGDAEALAARLPREKGPVLRVCLTRLGEARVAILGRRLGS
ncbi:MAG: hypothetical protein H6807_11110 [Planctomycetes bacterium]|nr:hypothetical protein [Planctomycetota bacterium]